MPADYNGRWEMVTNENFEDVMKALGKLPSYCLFNAYWHTVEVGTVACRSHSSIRRQRLRVHPSGEGSPCAEDLEGATL